MKSYKEIEKKHSPEEIAESLIFPGPKDASEREQLLSAFKKVRKQYKDGQSEESKLIAQLLQLKFLIEDYLKADSFNKEFYFGYFLKEYITRQEKKNKEFAQEIDVDPTELSQIINQHRKPTEKIIYRLELHSNRNFPAVMWFRLLEKEREYELRHNNKIVDSEKIHVKQQLHFSF
ncbi:helix-turn-helix domain-containing protein [Chitinophaga sp. CC14]|uniref:helix-turn-helix domain-containing protein n=1 Tax=Chitinophaga TaxID=79328 RepID=UPI000DBFA094|nr:helix-turn-helix domain-containing protein [Chitinophaga ginsengisegetis]MDR6567316.1 plasmid maintenance system antidote protein VapI [Chitinophaga ginsengisegetis]MDR6647047.1 plasmid maintenance system antidote protein VapI [Chitinophaga ginsengisegetis]MDR6653396.1 plasmid maintenance system antidote protein VapI [Chitinophaga ginsengisegetis]